MKKIYIINIILAGLYYSYCNAQQSVSKDTLAEKMLIYQLSNGAWPKQLTDQSVVNYQLPLTEELRQKIRNTGTDHATLDNNATTREINSLIQAFNATKNRDYLIAVEKGIDYLLAAQYDNGGFPQYYPNKSLYRAEITYNDNAMINALIVLDNIAKAKKGFEEVAPHYKTKAQKAVSKGISCILKTQIIQNGQPSIWAAQYNEKSLTPAQARKFEPASLSTSESVAIVRFLMAQDATAEIQNAVTHAIVWFQQNDIEGYRFDRALNNKTGAYERKLITDNQSVIWARFYDLKDNRPLFGDRDNSVKYNFEELSEERKNGYAWFGNWPEKLIQKDYPKWKKQHQIQ